MDNRGLPLNVQFASLSHVRPDEVQTAFGPSAAFASDATGIVAISEGVAVGLAICENWTATSVSVHLAVFKPMLLRHGFFEEIANFVFGTAGREQMIGFVPSDNVKALKLNENIGFKRIGLIPDGFDSGIDTVIMALKSGDCRFFDPKHRRSKPTNGQVHSTST